MLLQRMVRTGPPITTAMGRGLKMRKVLISAAVALVVALTAFSASAATLVDMCYTGAGYGINVKVDSTRVAQYQSRGYLLGVCTVTPSF